MSEQQPSEDPLRTARRRRHAAALHPMHSPVRLQRPGLRTVWPDNGDFASTDQCFLHGTGADVANVSSQWLYRLPQPRPHLWHYCFRHRYQLAPIGAAAQFPDLMVSRTGQAPPPAVKEGTSQVLLGRAGLWSSVDGRHRQGTKVRRRRVPSRSPTYSLSSVPPCSICRRGCVGC